MKTAQHLVAQARAIAGDFSGVRAIEAELRAETARLLAPYALGHIYVVEFVSDVVKVGKTTEPSTRLATHGRLAFIHGGAIRGSWVSRRLVGYDGAERELLDLCSRASATVAGREYFDIDFRAARSFGTLVEANRLAATDLPTDAQALLNEQAAAA